MSPGSYRADLDPLTPPTGAPGGGEGGWVLVTYRAAPAALITAAMMTTAPAATLQDTHVWISCFEPPAEGHNLLLLLIKCGGAVAPLR
jgi:hypothetical protein